MSEQNPTPPPNATPVRPAGQVTPEVRRLVKQAIRKYGKALDILARE